MSTKPSIRSTVPMSVNAGPRRLYGWEVIWYGTKRNQFGLFAVITVIVIPPSMKTELRIIIK